jgi:hypothetical protein
VIHPKYIHTYIHTCMHTHIPGVEGESDTPSMTYIAACLVDLSQVQSAKETVIKVCMYVCMHVCICMSAKETVIKVRMYVCM